MHEDLGQLRRSLEAGVDRPSFDSLSERADAITRRRRTHRVVLASSVAAAAIVFAAVVATSVPRDDSGYAGQPPNPEPAPSTSVPSHDRATEEVPTYVYGPAESGPVRVHLPKKLFGSAGPEEAAVELNATTTDGKTKRVEYFAFAERTASGVWKSSYSHGTTAPQCRGLDVRQSEDGTFLELPRRCLPVRGTTSRWTALGPPSGGLRSVEFVVTPLTNPDVDGVPEVENGVRGTLGPPRR